jgi:hypothetical protein
MHDLEAGVIRRHQELAAQGDHVGAQLEHGNARLREVAVAEPRHRASAQPDHDDMARARHEQGEAHHRAGIGQHQRAWPRQPHLALDVAGRELQRAAVALGAHQRLEGSWHGASICDAGRACYKG